MPVNERIATSPCVGRCSCTLGDDVCRGCGRTFEQVRDWPFYSREKKVEITRQLRSDSQKKLQEVNRGRT